MHRLLTLLVLITGVLPLVAQDGEVDHAFHYLRWTMDAEVSADNSWNIHEHYDCYFDVERHGVFRYLRERFSAYRNIASDGEPENIVEMYYAPKIELLSVSGCEQYETSYENDNYIIRLGDEYRYVIGEVPFGIRYDYRYPDDRIKARDYLFHSLLPDDVRSSIDCFQFSLHFEKALPADIASRLEFYTGRYGANNRAEIEDLVVTDHVISGTVRNVAPFQAITLYAELPEGYFEGSFSVSEWPFWFFVLASLVCLAFVFYYLLTDRGLPFTRSVEFYAPSGITPAEVGKIIDDSSDPIDIAALIPWLASEGYLTIRDIPAEKGLFGKKADVEITKVRDVPADAPAYQQRVMELLFDDSDVLRMSKMGDRHTLFNKAKSALDAEFSGARELVEIRHSWSMAMLILCTSLAAGFSSRVVSFDLETFIMTGIFWTFPFICAFLMAHKEHVKMHFTTPWKRLGNRVFRIVVFAILTACLYGSFFYMTNTLFDTSLGMQVGLVIVLGSFVACEMSGRFAYDTPYRLEMKGKLMGFKEFISTAEKDRLRLLVDQDPAYFYKVLPYAMVFGLTDKWVDVFKGIDVQPVSWYQTTSPIGSHNYIYGLTNGLSSTVSSAIQTSSVAPSSSGGGGGFSGGGGGGGGGGSW